jgi:hypothetical protein
MLPDTEMVPLFHTYYAKHTDMCQTCGSQSSLKKGCPTKEIWHVQWYTCDTSPLIMNCSIVTLT